MTQLENLSVLSDDYQGWSDYNDCIFFDYTAVLGANLINFQKIK